MTIHERGLGASPRADNPRPLSTTGLAAKPSQRESLPPRQVIEQQIEELIEILDQLDGDSDLEPNLGACWIDGAYRNADDLERDDSDLEPTLGATVAIHEGCAWMAARSTIPDEAEEDDPAEDAGDRAEPWLGSTNDYHDQRSWCWGGSNDGEGPDADREPWLAGYGGSDNDLEFDEAERYGHLADAGAADEFVGEYRAMCDFARERELTDPAGQARRLLATIEHRGKRDASTTVR